MTFYKTHFEVHKFGCEEARSQWKVEGLIQDKVKFCDGLMLPKERRLNFTSNTDNVDCKKCQKKLDVWMENAFDLPY